MTLATSPGTFTHYTGLLGSIPAQASPGIAFISAYLPAIDALDRSSDLAKKVDDLLAPDAVFITNGAPPVIAKQALGFLSMREKKLERFGHDGGDVEIWDMEEGGGQRKVVCEAISVSVFKEDEEKEEVKVHELLLLKLDKADDGHGIGGYWVTELKVYMNAAPVLAKAKNVMEK